MAVTLRLRGVQILFPPTCVVCGEPAEQQYKIERVFSYGARTINIQQNVPMCAAHFKQASFKSPAEIFVERLGVAFGILLGLATALALMIYWHNTEQGIFILNLFLALFLGAGFGLIAWTLISIIAAPRFASKEVRSIRNSVHLRRYAPQRNELDIALDNERVAMSVANANLDNFVSGAGLRLYHIKANLLCADIRLNLDIETRVLRPGAPTEKEAERYLGPIADRELNARNCEDCLYELRYLTIV